MSKGILDRGKKLFGMEAKTSGEELEVSNALLLRLADKTDVNSTETIIDLLNTPEISLDPYKKQPGKSSAFELAYNAGNIVALNAMYNYKPNPDYQPLLKDLASQQLLEEVQKESPSIEEVAFLLNTGADPTVKGSNGRSALNLAADLDNLELLHIMSAYTPEGKTTYLTQNAAQRDLFREAAKESPNHANIRFLLEKGADPFLKMPDDREAFKILEKSAANNPDVEMQ